MSSFYCDKCGALCSDTEHGYVSGCKHYPIDITMDEYNKKMSQIIAKNYDIDEALIALIDEASKYHIKSDKSSRTNKEKGKHGQKVSKVTKRVRK
jgi:hypothetical protein